VDSQANVAHGISDISNRTEPVHVLVTGGAGYIGSILVPALLARRHRVTVIDNMLYHQASLLDCCGDPALEVVRGDARDRDLIARSLKTADVIMPLACLTGAPLCDRDPIAAKTTNLDAIRMLLELRGRSQWIIFPTTNSGYGVGVEGVYCTEETPLNPISLYGRLKSDAETAILDAGNAVTFRLATVFGASPRMRLDLLVNDFTYRAVTDRAIVLFEAHFRRNFIHVRDVAAAFAHALDCFEAMKDQPYNVGRSDANCSKLELCEHIRQVVPDFYFTEARIGEDPDKRDYIVSNEKIEATGFRAAHSLDDGIRELVKAYRIIRKSTYANV